MNVKTKKIIFTLTLLSSVLLTIVIWDRINERKKYQQEERRAFLRIRKNTGPIIRGFQYNKYQEGGRAISIKAAKFSIEKKKIGIFKLSPFKIARFRDAEIDFYGRTDQSGNNTKRSLKPMSDSENDTATKHAAAFKGVLTQQMMPPSVLRGSVSAICEPVKINLHVDDGPATRILAEKAIVDPRKRRMILRDNVEVTSGSSHLSADRLAIYPETGLFKVTKEYVLETRGETISGENLTTDFFLEKVGTQ